MQTAAVKAVHATWLARAHADPNPSSNTRRPDKEYYLSSDTGDYVCLTCGDTGRGRDWPINERASREKPAWERCHVT